VSIYMNPKRRTGDEMLASVIFPPGKCLDDSQKSADAVALLGEGIRSHSGGYRVAGMPAAHGDFLDGGKSPPNDC
jgi:hypothetical protein